MPSPQSKIISFLLRKAVKRWSIEQCPVVVLRKIIDTSMRCFPLQKGVTITKHHPLKRGRASSPIKGEWIIPDNFTPSRIILYLHGGGYFCCSPQTHRQLTAGLARATRCPVFALQYRLAPEHPFPSALEDSIAAYQWLTQDLHFHPLSILIAGDSAGGGLALATLLTLRDASLPLPAAAACFSPWTDLAATGHSLRENSESCSMFYGSTIKNSARYYTAGTEPTHPLISPLYADLSGLPPLLIHASDTEALRDDSTRLVKKLQNIGAPVEFKLFHKQPHVWQLFPLLPETRQSLESTANFFLNNSLGHSIENATTFPSFKIP